MANDFYNESGKPFQASQGLSTAIRSEFTLIRQAFDKLPDVTGNAGLILQIDPLGSGNITPISDASLMTKIKTADGTGSGLDADLLDGQEGTFYEVKQNTWTDVIGSRSAGTTYTNSTNGPIDISVVFWASMGSGDATIRVDGIVVAYMSISTGYNTLQARVPKSKTYKVDSALGITNWCELSV